MRERPVFTDGTDGKDFDARVIREPMAGGAEWHDRQPMQGGEYKPSYDPAAVAELCEAEQSHYAYAAAERALKGAVQSLEVLLIRYSGQFGDPDKLWRMTSPDYQYTQDLFAPCLAALKAAQAFNEKRGGPTSLLVTKARDKMNPEVHRQAKEQAKEAERATRFCSSFLNWISKYEEPVTGETK